MSDKVFPAEVERLKLTVSHAPGAQAQDLIRRMYAAPPQVVARAKEAIRP